MPIRTKFFWKCVEKYCQRRIPAAGRRNSFCMMILIAELRCPEGYKFFPGLPTIIHSGRKVTRQREERENNAINTGHLVP
jgi:hypothetical protein